MSNNERKEELEKILDIIDRKIDKIKSRAYVSVTSDIIRTRTVIELEQKRKELLKEIEVLENNIK